MKNKIKSILRPVVDIYGKAKVRKHGFWFVDIPRTSSSSIHYELSQRYGAAYGKKEVNEASYRTHQLFSEHVPAEKMKEFFGAEMWDKLFTFSLVRNPFDRIFSIYNYRKKRGGFEDMTFETYIRELGSGSSSMFSYHGFRFGACDYLVDDSGEIMVDYVARYENRTNDLSKIGEIIGHESLGNVWAQRASPRDQHYSQWYTAEMKDIIYRLYEKDLELFGYQFEEV